MNIVSLLGLPSFNDRVIEELHYYLESYNEILSTSDKRVNQDARKKMILTNTFDVLSGLFDFDYNEKLKFNAVLDNTNDIYIDSLHGKNYEQLFFEIFSQCCKKYLKNIYLNSTNRVNDEMFTIVRLSYLNKEELMINYLVLEAYYNLLEDCPWLIDTQISMETNKTSLSKLRKKNSMRNQQLIEEVMSYKPYEDISHFQMRNVFKCYSTDVFIHLRKKEKLHLLNLSHNYFLVGDKKDISNKYNSMIDDKTSNKECLQCVIESLLEKGNTLSIIKRNRDKIKDILSWTQVVDSNETNKANLNSLSDLNKLMISYKR